MPSSNIVGKLITTSMVDHSDSIVSENTLHEIDDDDGCIDYIIIDFITNRSLFHC